MSQQIKMLNEDNVRTILKWINLSASIDEKIDDLNIRTDACYSSKKVTDYAQEIKHDLEAYIQSSINGLTHLKKKIVDTLPSDADTEENILYLVKDTSVVDDVVYNQYLLIDGVLEPLGNTSTDMSNYYNKDESDAKFALLSNLQTLIDMVGNASDLETTAKDTLVSAINEIKEGLDDCITKDAIVTTLDDTVTDEQVPSAKAVEERVKNMCTTSIADVDKVVIPLTGVTNYKASKDCECFYTVKNGICFVCLAVDCVTPQSDVFVGNVPAPTQVFRFSMARPNTAMHGYVLLNGELRLNGGIAGEKYFVTTFSYPVAE